LTSSYFQFLSSGDCAHNIDTRAESGCQHQVTPLLTAPGCLEGYAGAGLMRHLAIFKKTSWKLQDQ